MEWSLLLLLICSLMMMFGMKMLHGQGSFSNGTKSEWSLEKEYNELRVQNEQLKKIRHLSK
ncbi:hypothetical protein CA600_29705 [Paenibacillus sp. VTT E-133280]|uniref:DUF2933 domain-containing protein n=1 Tax=unclassified Paenibacillus TaxID=185978 RepID=UPI000BA11075|nr:MULTISPECIES: DUF2933 domain-containing protein [unclassified Paenibacillus]MBY3621367.1 DUF2933 domain-containing protein [Acinetobacter sp. CUI P1]MDH6373025.1 putative membrane protein [Paenibacillus sp. PastF-3]OZQ59332.1 hypothetical protein CA600_29705 [Paenibacillus sp. VTT E-133280]OZQ80703.1 hypothetical protein CA598_27640 [Paenibacillus sp. VTT E-133291]